MAPKKKIPDGWLDYYPINDVFPDARLVPFKSPLPEEKFYGHLASHKWTTHDAMDSLRRKGWDLGLVIDFTAKIPAYYNPEDFTRNGVAYVKIKCDGHIVPADTYYQKFCEVVRDFTNENKMNNRIIGIHCTHGINRTGYMLCRYLIENLNYRPDHAIQSFADKRGYPIERENYTTALRNLVCQP